MEQLIELNDAYRGTALLLGDVVEADDAYTGEHCRDVVHLALEVARELGLDIEQQRLVEFGALLHDIGKIAVPKEIVNKPSKLDPREWEIIKTHTVEGQRMLDRVGGFMGNVGRIVRSHHERWDGGGYPDGLRGRDPAGGADHLLLRRVQRDDHRRPYRRAMPPRLALAELWSTPARSSTRGRRRAVRVRRAGSGESRASVRAPRDQPAHASLAPRPTQLARADASGHIGQAIKHGSPRADPLQRCRSRTTNLRGRPEPTSARRSGERAHRRGRCGDAPPHRRIRRKLDAAVEERFARVGTVSTIAVARWMAGEGAEVAREVGQEAWQIFGQLASQRAAPLNEVTKRCLRWSDAAREVVREMRAASSSSDQTWWPRRWRCCSAAST